MAILSEFFSRKLDFPYMTMSELPYLLGPGLYLARFLSVAQGRVKINLAIYDACSTPLHWQRPLAAVPDTKHSPEGVYNPAAKTQLGFHSRWAFAGKNLEIRFQ